MMCHHSPAMKIIGCASWLLCSIAAIAWGLLALGESLNKSLNIWDFLAAQNLSWIILPAQYIIGAAGVISLIAWFMCLGHCHEGHDHKR